MENTVNLKSSIAWSDFKLNSDGMVPVIAQDYQTNEVLMLAYMNEEAFNTTLETGKMTYWSRSRNELWTKGLTSGHLQFVKSLTLDCDNDTILAKGRLKSQAPDVDGNMYIEDCGDKVKPGDILKVQVEQGFAYDVVATIVE